MDMTRKEINALLAQYYPPIGPQRDAVRVPITLGAIEYWVSMGALKRTAAQGTSWEVTVGTQTYEAYCDGDRTLDEPKTVRDPENDYAVPSLRLTAGTWCTDLRALFDDDEDLIRATPLPVGGVAIPAPIAHEITRGVRRGDRQFLCEIEGTVYYTNGHYLLRYGPAQKVAGERCLDFGGKPVRKGGTVPRVYKDMDAQDACMPDCERVIPNLKHAGPPVAVDVAEVTRLHSWWKGIDNHERFNGLAAGGVYTNFEQGSATWDIPLRAGYNIEYLKVAADWCGAGSLWYEGAVSPHLSGMRVESADGTRLAVVMPLRV